MRPQVFAFLDFPGGGGGSPPFDPATLNLSLWQKPAYAGLPWSGTASAGTSGTNSWVSAASGGAAGADPTIGAEDEPSFSAAAQSGAFTNDTIDTMFGVGATQGTIAVLFYATSATTNVTGTPYDNPQLFSTYAGGYINLNYTADGVQANVYDGSYHPPAAIPASTNSWHLAQMRWNGTILEVRVDGGAWTSQVNGPPPTAAYEMQAEIGAWFGGAVYWFDGKIREQIASPDFLSDTDLDNYRSYCNAAYGISV